jgi:PAS domain S-box-containing protein
VSTDVYVIIYLLPYLISFGISFGVGVFAWRRRSVPGAASFAVVSWSMAFWTLGFVFELFSISLEGKNFWDSIQYLFMVTWLWGFFSFAGKFTQRPLLFPRFAWPALIVFPLLVLGFIFTNKYHGLFKQNIQLASGEPFSRITYDLASIAWVFFAFFCIFYLRAFIELIIRLLTRHQLYRAQVVTIIVGVAFPMIGLILTALGITLLFNRDTGPLMFAISSLAVAWGLFRYQLFNVVPIARDAVIDTLDDAIFVVDTENRLIDLNPTAERIVGQTASEAIGKPAEALLSQWADLVEKYLPVLKAQFEVKVSVDNQPKTLEIRLIPLYDRQKSFVGRVIVGHDITQKSTIAEELRQVNEELESRVATRTAELQQINQQLISEIEKRKKTAEELIESEHKYRDLVENIDEVVFTLDLAGRFTYVSPAIKPITGYEPEEMLNEGSIKFILPDDRAPVAVKFDATLLGTVEPREYRIVTKSGEIRWVRTYSRPIEESGKIVGLQGVLSDVTESRRTREVMIQTEKMMSVGGLAAGMAHELNNPLGAMLQSTQNVIRRLSADLDKNRVVAKETGVDLSRLKKYLDERGILKSLESIRESGQRAGGIIANMLQFSRRSGSHLAPTDLAKLIDSTLDLARNDYNLKKSFDFRNIEIVKEIEDNMPLVPCTETEIEQVLLNLLKNAAQAAGLSKEPGNPRINLRVRTEGENAVVEVEDNGPGMKESVRLRAFEPFYTTKPVGEGTGLGLSVSFMIITQNHQGTIEVESVPGEGTRFIIHLPLVQNHETVEKTV